MFSNFNRILQVLSDGDVLHLIYHFCNNIAMYIALIFYLFYASKFHLSWVKRIVILVFTYIWVSYCAQFVLWIEAGFTTPQRANYIAGFVYMPLGCWLVSKLTRVSYRVTFDYMASMPMLLHACYRVGCTFAGCCKGIPYAQGIYNHYTDSNLFPVQPLEALVSVLILVFILIRNKQRSYNADGLSIPIMLISYGVARFVLEFFHDNEKILLALSTDNIHSAVMTIVGVILLVVLMRTKHKMLNTKAMPESVA